MHIYVYIYEHLKGHTFWRNQGLTTPVEALSLPAQGIEKHRKVPVWISTIKGGFKGLKHSLTAP